MDPLPTIRAGGSQARDTAATRGIPQALRQRPELAAFAGWHPRDVVAGAADLRLKELELASFGGEPVYVGHLGGGATRVVALDGHVRAEFDRRRIAEIAAQAASPIGLMDVRVLDQYDMYYRDRHHQRPLPVIMLTLNDAEHDRYYIDPKTARVVGTYSSRDWVTRWLYHGLHSLDVPWLYGHRPAWDIVVIAFMVGGTSLAVTALVLAWQALGRRLTGSRAPVASGDIRGSARGPAI
jgi:hypothetical protein